MLRRVAITTLILLLAVPLLGRNNRRAYLVTYGPQAPTKEGDDDFRQVIRILVPESVTEKLHLRLFDADCGGLEDTIYGTADTETRFSLLAMSETVLERKSFGVDPGLDNEWHTVVSFEPSAGEKIDGQYAFQLVVEGVSGNDGNAFDVAVSNSDARNVTPEGVVMLTDAPTLRIEGDGAAEMTFAIPSTVSELTVHTFDTARAGVFLETPFHSRKVDSADQGLTVETTVSLESTETGGRGALSVYNDGAENPNDATIWVTDQAGGAIPIELPIRMANGNRRPTPKLFTKPLAECNSIVFDGTESSDADGDSLAFLWDFGDGQTGEGRKIVHRYERAGAYEARVEIRDSSGWVGNGVREALTVRVNHPPVAKVNPPRKAAPGESVSFDGTTSRDPDGGTLRYLWGFGDGSEGTGAQTTHEYSEAGRYTVTLRVEDDSDSPCNWHDAQTQVFVNAPPVAEAGKDLVASVGESIAFDGSRSYDRDGEIAAFTWNLGDGATRTGATTEYAFPKPGKYQVTLEVRDDARVANSTASDHITVVINDPPVARAGEDRRVSVGEVTFFDASSSSDADGQIASYEWDFGDGNRGKGVRTPYAYDFPGTYTVTVRVRDSSPAASGVATDTLTVTVNAAPVAEAGPDQVVTTSEVRFDGSRSSDPDGRIETFEWDFGDGSRGKGARPAHIYQRPGVYHVKLTVTDDSGTSSSSDSDPLTVVVNERPAADAGPNRTVAPGEATAFAAFESLDSDGEIVYYKWDFGDGESATGKAVEHAYREPGSYVVRLTVQDDTDDPKAVDFDETLVTVNARPVAKAGPDVLAAPGESVRFDGRGSFDPDGELTAYRWRFSNDREDVSEPVTERKFESAGVYTARLTVTDSAGVSNSQHGDEVQIHINNPPKAVPGKNVLTCDGVLTFDGSASVDADGQPLTHEWDFGDGTSAFGRVVSHVFAEGGVYPVTLTVDDGTGLSNARHTASLVTTINRPPIASPGADTTVCAGEVALFDGSGSTDPDGGALRYLWDFGDGTRSDLMNPTQIYKQGGVYTATLLVQDDSGLTCNADTARTTVRVAESPAAQAGSDMTVCANSRVRFDGTASTDPDGVVNRFHWDFGDETAGGGPTPEHIFTEPGSYRVLLTVTGDLVGSCDNTDTDELLVQVRPSPVVAITGPDLVPVGELVSFDGLKSTVEGAQIISWQWDFGGESPLDGERVSHVFDEPGPHTVTLSITTDVDDACRTVSAQKVVTANLAPLADAGEDLLVGVNELITLSGMLSKDPDGAIVSYDWDFGDGASGNGVQARHRYREPGRYTVKLRVQDDTDVANSSSVDTMTVTVNAPPSPVIQISDAACVAEPVAFDGSGSFDPDGELVAYRWSFGNGQTAEGADVFHAFAAAGQYQVTLSVDDDAGVNNSRQERSFTLPVNHPPRAEAGPDLTVCSSEEVTFDGVKSVDRDGQLTDFLWSFGDGSEASGAKVTHSFATPGRYEVKLAVKDNSGTACDTAVDSAIVRVNAPPTAFTEPVTRVFTGGAHDTVLFDATDSSDPDGDALIHAWDFGDGNKKTGAKVFHAYGQPGDYTVRLTVKDGTGLSCGEATREFALEVRDRAAVAEEPQSNEKKD
jgi:PKD repeat protein